MARFVILLAHGYVSSDQEELLGEASRKDGRDEKRVQNFNRESLIKYYSGGQIRRLILGGVGHVAHVAGRTDIYRVFGES
jgi:hypothetical protein